MNAVKCPCPPNRARLCHVDLVKKNGRFGVKLEKHPSTNFYRIVKSKTNAVPQGALIVAANGIPGNTIDVLAYLRSRSAVALILQVDNVGLSNFRV